MLRRASLAILGRAACVTLGAACAGPGPAAAPTTPPTTPPAPWPTHFDCLQAFRVTGDAPCVRVSADDLVQIQRALAHVLEAPAPVVSPDLDLAQARRLASVPPSTWTYRNYMVRAIERPGHAAELLEIELTEPWISDNGRRGSRARLERTEEGWRVLAFEPYLESPVRPQG